MEIDKILFEKKLLEKIVKYLPEELADLIKLFIPLKVMIFIDKSLYLNNHSFIEEQLKSHSENYIRTMIRQDNDFIFKQIFIQNITKWLNMKNYYYKDYVYLNYIYFLLVYCEENDSEKCKNLLIILLNELGLYKNQHKKKTSRYIKWKK